MPIDVPRELYERHKETVFRLSTNVQVRRGDPVRQRDWQAVEQQRELGGLTDAEIAERLGLSEAQVTFIRTQVEKEKYRFDAHQMIYSLKGNRADAVYRDRAAKQGADQKPSPAASNPSIWSEHSVNDSVKDLARRLALACRVVALQGHSDLIFGHLSVRLPDAERMLMKPNGLGLDEVFPEDMLLMDFDGNVLEGRHGAHLEYPIHAEILRARPDVACVVHTHPYHAIAVGASEHELIPFSEHGCYFVPPAVPKFSETTDLIVTRQHGQALARTLGAHKAVLMVDHGVAVTGPTIEEAAIAAVLLEEACQIQVLTLGLGPSFHPAPEHDAIAKRTRVFPSFIPSLWAYLVRQVVRKWPECKAFSE